MTLKCGIIKMYNNLGGEKMFRKNKCKKRKKVTETLTVNGYDVIMISNISIEKKGVKKSIAEYAVSAIDFEEQFDSIAALISLDFFKGIAQITIQKINSETLFIKIKHHPGGKKNDEDKVFANKEIDTEQKKIEGRN